MTFKEAWKGVFKRRYSEPSTWVVNAGVVGISALLWGGVGGRHLHLVGGAVALLVVFLIDLLQCHALAKDSYRDASFEGLLHAAQERSRMLDQMFEMNDALVQRLRELDPEFDRQYRERFPTGHQVH